MPSQAAARFTRSLFGVTLLAASSLLANNTFARDFEIRYYERLERMHISGAEPVSFVAYGRQFDLLLESNAGIIATANAPDSQNVALYRGRLAGIEDSWVRLSETNGRLAGAIWDGTEIWLLESSQRLGDYLIAPDSTAHASQSGSVIFRLSEVSGSLGDLVNESHQNEAQATISDPAAINPLVAAASFGPQPGRVLDIGLVAAADFADRHGAQAPDVLLEIFNVVEGIFITQVGVQLRAAEISILNSTPADLETLDPQALLRNFADYKARTSELRPLGLAHLFVSRDLDDLNPPTRTVGMANLSVLCDQRFGVGITQATHATILDALIAAHEFGHNFGAPHDAESGSACAVEADNFIMAPRISGSTRFSQCSIAEMQTEILTAGCMREIPPTDLQLTIASPPPTQVYERDTVDFSIVLSNLSNSHVAGVELLASSDRLSRLTVNVDAIDDGYCDTTSQLQCIWPWFPAGASVVLNMSAFAEDAGSGSIDVSIDSLHELDASDNALRFDIEVTPLAELVSLLSPDSVALHPGEAARFEAAVFNRGNAATSGVVVHISVDPGLELAGNELRDCIAAPVSGRVIYTCPVGSLGASQSLSFGFSASVPANIDLASIRADSTAMISVYATSDDILLSDADRSAQSTVTIGEVINDLDVTINGPNLVEIGQQSVWEIAVLNHGPDPAAAIRVYDTDAARMLPSDGARIETSHGECMLSGSNTEFDCTIPSLEVGERALITLSATPATSGQFFWIEAATETTAPDGNPGNNRTSLLVAASTGATAEPPDSTSAGSNSAQSEESGGGSTNLGILLFIGLLGLIRRRRNGLQCRRFVLVDEGR